MITPQVEDGTKQKEWEGEIAEMILKKRLADFPFSRIYSKLNQQARFFPSQFFQKNRFNVILIDAVLVYAWKEPA